MSTGTLTGTYKKADGTAQRGTVYINPSVDVVRDATGNVIMSGSVGVKLDVNGSFSVALAATDDATLDPVGVTYRVSLRGLPPVTGVVIHAGQSVDMADITPVSPTTPTYAAWAYGTGGGGGGGGAVSSVNAKTGAVVLSASDVGADALGAAATAITAHIAATDPHGDRAYTSAQIAALVNGAPGILDTLGEIATQLATDESAVGALTTAVNARLAAANNLSDLPDKVAARTNLGLGSAATQPSSAFDAAGAAAAAVAALPAPFAVVNYAGNVGAARPTADFVSWRGFPDQPTNMQDFDEWLDDSPETYPVQTVAYSGNLSVARPTATVVIWQDFPSQPTNMADGDLWIDPTTQGAVLSGAGAPTGTDGNNGDFWIRTSNSTLYGPKASGAWPTGVSLVGATGTGTPGRGVSSIARTSGTGAAGTTDTYTITYSDATTSTFTVANGANGVGVPTGGSTGQVLAKNSATDYDTAWTTVSGGGGGYLPTFTSITGIYMLLYGHNQNGSGAVINNRLYLTPFYLSQSVTFSRVGIEVVTAGNAGAVFRCAVYNDAGGYPGTPEIDTTVAADAVANPEATISTTLAAGWHWGGGAPQNAATTAPVVRSITSVMPPGFMIQLGTTFAANSTASGYFKASVTGALPTFGTPPLSPAGLVPRLYFKVA